MSGRTFIRRLLRAWVKDHPEDICADVTEVMPRIVRRMALRTGVTVFLHRGPAGIQRIGMFKICLPSQ